MKRIIISVLCSLPLLGFGQNILLYNDGAMVKVQAGAILYIQGGIQNTSTGTIDNDGIIEVEGNFVNAGAWEPSQPNTLRFSGTGNSDVTSGSAVFQTVEDIKSGGNVNLLDPMTVNTDLNFNSAGATRIMTGNFDLKLGNSATVTGPDADEYVATTGTGMMQKGVTGDNTFVFPIGDVTNYSPLSCNYTGSAYAAANLRAKANDLTHPSKPADASDYISRYWDIDQTGITGYSNTMTGTYIPADVNGTASLIKGAVYDGSNWAYAGAAAGSNTVTGATAIANADFTGTNFFGFVNLKVFLQGPYNTGTGLMSTTLTTNPTIEALMLTSPYADAPATVADVPTDVTDWVKIEFRDPANPATIIGKGSNFLKKDGSVVGLDGTSFARVKNGLPNSLVGVIHRNHLGIRTPNDTILNVVNPALYDFSLSLAKAYDNPANTTNDAMNLMSNGKYVMFAGNCNQTGAGENNIKYTGSQNDHSTILTALGGNTLTILSNVYNVADLNMNGQVKYTGSQNDHAVLLTVLGGNTLNIWTRHN